MHQLVYLSRATRSLDSAEMQTLVSAARVRNAETGVTGLLLFDGYRFIQALEGPKACVGAIMASIRIDPRHKDLVYMPDRIVGERQFGSWSMRGRTLTDAADAEAFYLEVPALLAEVTSPEIFAAFMGFASMSRMHFGDRSRRRVA